MTAKNKIINVLPYELNLHALIFRIPLNQFRYILKSGIKVQSVKSILQYFRFFWQKVVIIAIWELERVSNLGLVLNFYPSIVDSLPQLSTRTLFTNTRSKWSSETESKYELCGDSTSSWNEMLLFFFRMEFFYFFSFFIYQCCHLN